MRLIIKIVKRKIKRLNTKGKRSFGIAIPPTWMKKYNLKEGDNLNVMVNLTLRIYPTRERERLINDE